MNLGMLIILFIVLIIVGLFFWAIYTAPEGYEDKNGYHEGKPEDKNNKI